MEFYSTLECFLDRKFQVYFTQDFEATRSSQLKIDNSSRDPIIPDTTNFELEFRLKDFKKFMKLSGRQKFLVWMISRYFSIRLKNSNFKSWGFLSFDLTNLLTSRGFDSYPKYSYLRKFDDVHFLVAINELFGSKSEIREIARQLGNPAKPYGLSLYEFLINPELFCVSAQYYPKRKSKRLIRHKGYRDHGSLGSDASRIRREEDRDFQLTKQAWEDEIHRDDFDDFIRGFLE